AAKEAEEKLSKFGVEMIFRDDLNTAVKEYAATDEAGRLEGEKARFLEFMLRDLRRAGHELDPETRAEVKAKTERLVELGVRFQQNIDEWEAYILVDRDGLDGLPDSYIEGLERDEETGRYRVSIDYPELFPFLENARRRDLREELRFKFNTVAVDSTRRSSKKRSGSARRSPRPSTCPAGPTTSSRNGWPKTPSASAPSTPSCARRSPTRPGPRSRRSPTSSRRTPATGPSRRGTGTTTTPSSARPTTGSTRSRWPSTSLSSRCWTGCSS